MISLDIKSVTDEILALTALRGAVCGLRPDTIPPILTRDHLPALRVLVRASFSTLVSRLSPFVADSLIEEGNPQAERPYDDRQRVTLAVDFGSRAASLTAGASLTLKRYLEHLLALSVLEKVYLPINAAIAAEHASEASTLLSSVTTLLTSSDTPGDTLLPCYL